MILETEEEQLENALMQSQCDGKQFESILERLEAKGKTLQD